MELDMHGSVTEYAIDGRPDLAWGNSGRYGVTQAKSFPPYVFSIGRGAALVHKIARVDLHWYAASSSDGGQRLLKRRHPRMLAQTVCGATRFLGGARSRTCRIPEPDALLCGRCHGEPATFGKDGAATKAGIRRREAGVKLGCVVAGY